MIPVETNRFVETSGPLQTINFGVKEHNMQHLMSILRDQLYSDKKLAPIREYSCNAVDANIENGKKDVPIKVTLPNENFHELKIRDYGKGLSYEEMVNIFCSYGESTKRNSNDYIGQLGIGSKSGFAYGDNFMVTSYKHGKKEVYTCVLDKSGIGSLINLISSFFLDILTNCIHLI
jgi:HSP90 family molecular chaperone